MTVTTAGRFNTDGGVHEVPLPAPVTGRLWLCGKHVVGPDPDALLDRLGAHTVVCLVEDHELADRYPGYLEWLGTESQRAVRFPIHDLGAPPFDRAETFVDELVSMLRSGRGVVLHCGAGIGRAGTVATAALLTLGMELDAALVHVRAHRPMAGPEVGPQLELLERFSAATRARRRATAGW